MKSISNLICAAREKKNPSVLMRMKLQGEVLQATDLEPQSRKELQLCVEEKEPEMSLQSVVIQDLFDRFSSSGGNYRIKWLNNEN